MNSKTIGDFSQLMIISKFVKLDIPISIPYGDNNRYDAIIEISKKLYKIQIKTGRIENGAMHFYSCSSENHRGRGRKSYRNDVDFFAVYCPCNDRCYMIHCNDASEVETCIRITPAKNNQTKLIRNEENFIFETFINNILKADIRQYDY